jgi:hypothetical protein
MPRTRVTICTVTLRLLLLVLPAGAKSPTLARHLVHLLFQHKRRPRLIQLCPLASPDRSLCSRLSKNLRTKKLGAAAPSQVPAFTGSARGKVREGSRAASKTLNSDSEAL